MQVKETLDSSDLDFARDARLPVPVMYERAIKLKYGSVLPDVLERVRKRQINRLNRARPTCMVFVLLDPDNANKTQNLHVNDPRVCVCTVLRFSQNLWS